MQINLKQSEIEVALKNYIAHQGISLSGKDVSISFTAGRKEAGISADISIEDVAIPGFDTEEVEPMKPQLVAAATITPFQQEVVEEPVVETETTETATEAKTTSLFG